MGYERACARSGEECITDHMIKFDRVLRLVQRLANRLRDGQIPSLHPNCCKGRSSQTSAREVYA